MGKAFIGNFKGPTGPQGPKGDPGEIAAMPSIGDNGNWHIGAKDTGILADIDHAVTNRVVQSTTITEPGFIMDGKTCSEILEALSVDYVIERGNNYTKWSSGKLEIWGIDTFAGTSNTEQIRTVNFPCSFVNTSYVALLTMQRNGNLATLIREGDGGGNTNRTVDSMMAYCKKVASNYTISFNYFVVGKWKEF